MEYLFLLFIFYVFVADPMISHIYLSQTYNRSLNKDNSKEMKALAAKIENHEQTIEDLVFDSGDINQEKVDEIKAQKRLNGITPCGQYCHHAFFDIRRSRFVCRANLGKDVETSYKLYEDKNGNCRAFIPSEYLVQQMKRYDKFTKDL